MKRKLRVLVLLVSMVAFATTMSAAEDDQETPAPKKKGFFSGLNPFHSKQEKKPKPARPKRTPSPTPSASAESIEGAAPEPSVTATPSATPKQTPAPNASVSTEEISDYDNNPPEVRKIIEIALGLTSLNLDYRYGSADPVNGGMDCSGFIYFVLLKCGMSDIARDAREQYIWVRKAGNFQAVLAQSDDTFELNDLQPGDLLFWADTHSPNREPAITETMIYLGREKGTGQRLMVGASDGRLYKDQPRSGVSVVDFKVVRPEQKSDDHSGPTFVGYGRVPGLTQR